MRDLSVIELVIVAVEHSGSFGKQFVSVVNKIKMLFTSLGRSVLGKTVPSGDFYDLGNSFS